MHKVLLEAYNANLADLEAHRGALAAGADALIAQELITGELLNLRACVCHALAPVLAICAGALAPRRGLKGGGSTGRCVLASTCLQSKALCAGSPFLPASHACSRPQELTDAPRRQGAGGHPGGPSACGARLGAPGHCGAAGQPAARLRGRQASATALLLSCRFIPDPYPFSFLTLTPQPDPLPDALLARATQNCVTTTAAKLKVCIS